MSKAKIILILFLISSFIAVDCYASPPTNGKNIEIPKLKKLKLRKKRKSFNQIDFECINPEESEKVYSYFLVWAENNQPIQVPTNGIIYNENCQYITSEDYAWYNEFSVKKLQSDQLYRFKVYRYAGNNENIVYEKGGSKIVTLKTKEEGVYNKVSVNNPISCIESVECANITNNGIRPSNGYNNFSQLSIDVNPTTSYTLNVGLNIPQDIYHPTVRVFIDLNYDGFIDQETECIYTNTKIKNGRSNIKTYLNLPTSSIGDRNRLRIACYSIYHTPIHIEDYVLHVSKDVIVKGRWTGSISDDWNNPMNWHDQIVPNRETNVSIIEGAPYYPKVKNNIYARQIYVKEGGKLRIISGSKVDIDGGVLIKGRLQVDNGEINIKHGLIISGENSIFEFNNGTINGDFFSNHHCSVWYTKGHTNLNGGKLNFNLFEIRPTSRSSTSEKCNINIKEEFDIDVSDWNHCFKSQINFIQSNKVHTFQLSSIDYHNRGSEEKAILKKINIDIGNDTLIVDLDCYSTLTVQESINLVNGVVKDKDRKPTRYHTNNLNVKDIFIAANSKMELKYVDTYLSGLINGEGDYSSSTITFNGKYRQHCNVTLSAYSLTQESRLPLSIYKDITLQNIQLNKNNLVLEDGVTLKLTNNALVNLHGDQYVELKKGSKIIQHKKSDYQQRALPIKIEDSYVKILCNPTNISFSKEHWISYAYRTTEEANIIAPKSLPFVLDISSSESLKEKQTICTIELEDNNREIEDLFWAYQTDVWKEDGKVTNIHKHEFSLDSPNGSFTCMSKRAAPSVFPYYINENQVKLENTNQDTEYLYKFAPFETESPTIYDHNNGIIFRQDNNENHSLSVAFQANEFSIISDFTNNLMIPRSISTAVESINESNDYEIYPNPIVSQMTISTNDSKSHKYILLDLAGRVIERYSTTSNKTTVDVNLPQGVYIIKEMETGVDKKIIVK
ncbi:MAG: T9SS type A sorting domain-containing protein [Prolixibacteraceae bacterium]|jgi:hypothetical protein|nr:T9SS type A sorting domain-containing protein [Prolixibacteraceae bacterium]